MGTRSGIARRLGDGFEGRYHHWDGYPTGLGQTLWQLYHGHFNQGLRAMLAYLIDEHPAGWSTINDADFTQPPGFHEAGFKSTGPQCYCHGGRKERTNTVTHANGCGMEWAYVFDEETNVMAVLEWTLDGGGHGTGFFGFNPPGGWRLRWVGSLDGPEPHWAALEELQFA